MWICALGISLALTSANRRLRKATCSCPSIFLRKLKPRANGGKVCSAHVPAYEIIHDGASSFDTEFGICSVQAFATRFQCRLNGSHTTPMMLAVPDGNINISSTTIATQLTLNAVHQDAVAQCAAMYSSEKTEICCWDFSVNSLTSLTMTRTNSRCKPISTQRYIRQKSVNANG